MYVEGIVKCGGDRVWVILGGVGCIQFYEGVKDSVGEDGMVIVKVGAGCMWTFFHTGTPDNIQCP